MRVHADMLRAAMRLRDVSYGSLAAYVGCHRSFVSHLTSGRSSGASIETAKLIAQGLAMPIEVLFEDGPVPEAPAKTAKAPVGEHIAFRKEGGYAGQITT